MLINFWKNIRRVVNNIDNKYELILSDKGGLYRVKALKDFNDVKKGDIGGYVESGKNLSQLGDCWIYDDAIVMGNAVVRDNARVEDTAQVYSNAKICGNASVFDYAKVWGNAIVRGNARVLVNASVLGNAVIQDNAVIRGDVVVCDNTIVRDNVVIGGDVDICGDAIISSDKDYIVFKNWWSSGRYFTWTRSNNMWKVGCFYGSGEELIAKAYKDSEESGREYENIVKYVEIVNNF